MAGGRPTIYCDELVEEICTRIAKGESVTSFASTNGIPSEDTIYRWIWQHKEFAEKYARAREIQSERYLDRIMDVAHDGAKDWIMTKRGPVVDNECVMRSKLRIDAMKWQMSKLMPKKYGERVALEHSADDSLAEKLKEARLNALAID